MLLSIKNLAKDFKEDLGQIILLVMSVFFIVFMEKRSKEAIILNAIFFIVFIFIVFKFGMILC